MNGKSQIVLKNISKAYRTGGKYFIALKKVNLEINKGEFITILGKSGSGKSTLLNMLTAIDRPTEGGIIINNTKVHNLNEGETAVFRGRNIGVVFQFFQLLPTLTILENILLPMDFCNIIKPGKRKERAMDLLKKVSIEDQAHKLPSNLSGGQQQRAAIARALANDPEILTADEPTGNLDSQTANDMYHIFSDLAQEGKTLLIVSHDKDLSKISDRTIIIKDGIISSDEKNGFHSPQSNA